MPRVVSAVRLAALALASVGGAALIVDCGSRADACRASRLERRLGDAGPDGLRPRHGSAARRPSRRARRARVPAVQRGVGSDLPAQHRAGQAGPLSGSDQRVRHAARLPANHERARRLRVRRHRDAVYILAENGPNILRIYTDGRKHPPPTSSGRPTAARRSAAGKATRSSSRRSASKARAATT